MSLGKEEAQEFLLPKNLAKKTFADASIKLADESKERELDRISQLGRDTMLSRLAMAQETMREDPNNMFAEGGQLTRLGSLLNSPATKSMVSGGRANKQFRDKSNTDVDTNQLNAGIRVEMEHTKNPKVAREIALDHLKEDPQYYTKLVGSGIADEKIPGKVLEGLGLGQGNEQIQDMGQQFRLGGNLYKEGDELTFLQRLGQYGKE